MAGKAARQMKARWYPAIGATLAALLCLVSGWVVFKRLTTSAIDPAAIDPLSAPSGDVSIAKPAPVPTVAPQIEAPAGSKQPISKPGTRQGVFRVGNPTSYPVRVALLPKKTGGTAATKGSNAYEPPAHWDFAPEEGGAQGLLVSLPDRTLKLKKGDVLVAFAQDGSGRYWGPYVVDETALPTWNASAAEWQLILQP